MATSLAPKRAFDPPEIPDRLYFKIGDVARICEVETYVLRFWETQFPQLKPNKSGTGQRLYRRRDVELALTIKRLVHSEGYTLQGARQTLAQSSRVSDSRQREMPSQLSLLATEPAVDLDVVASTIAQIRNELRDLARELASPDPKPQRRRARITTLPAPGMLFPL
jgi:DNA-binding transcriptional MerR regulator